jgi:hypothetical protein
MDTQTKRFADVLEARMKEQNVSIKDLSDRTEATYETIRLLVRGGSFPSLYLLRVICDVLLMNYDDMKLLVATEKAHKKLGHALASFPDPAFAPAGTAWAKLTPKQQKDFIKQMEAVAQGNVVHH